MAMRLHGPVFVGTDLTPGSDEALRQARRLAIDLGSEFVVCHVLPEIVSVRMLFPQWAGIDPEWQETIADKARCAVEERLQTALGTDADDARIVFDWGTEHSGLLAQAEAARAGVIVIGPGRVTERVVRHAAAPVLVAKPSPHGVVIGATDFSDPSLPALEMARSEAQRRRSALHLLHVIDVGAYALAGAAGGGVPYVGATQVTVLQSLDDLRVAADVRLEEILNRFAIDGQATAASGAAAPNIVDLAGKSRAELVVVGTRGRDGLARLTLGSTAEAVIRSAPCSVLVVRLSAGRPSA
jgi:universal stress protein A